MKNQDLQRAIESANKLQSSVSRGSLDIAYQELERSIAAFENEGYPVDTIIPMEGSSTLGFAMKLETTKDGKSFWNIYSELIRKSLCSENGELNKLIKGGVHTSVGAILTAIVSGLGIPVVALAIMIPIAVLIFNTGIDAFCALSK